MKPAKGSDPFFHGLLGVTMRAGDQVMASKPTRERDGEREPATSGQFTTEPERGEAPAWEEVAAGRYMPRRIKGSCKGRALG
jgi:hypothetical protein